MTCQQLSKKGERRARKKQKPDRSLRRPGCLCGPKTRSFPSLPHNRFGFSDQSHSNREETGVKGKLKELELRYKELYER